MAKFWFSELIDGVYHFYMTIGRDRYATNEPLRQTRHRLYDYRQSNDPRAINTLASIEHNGVWYEHFTTRDYNSVCCIMSCIAVERSYSWHGKNPMEEM